MPGLLCAVKLAPWLEATAPPGGLDFAAARSMDNQLYALAGAQQHGNQHVQ